MAKDNTKQGQTTHLESNYMGIVVMLTNSIRAYRIPESSTKIGITITQSYTFTHPFYAIME